MSTNDLTKSETTNLKLEKEKMIELSDEELEKVTGGWGVKFSVWDRPNDVPFKWGIGARVERVYYVELISGHVCTSACTVVDRMAAPNTWGSQAGFVPVYKVTSGDSDYNNTWQPEFYFEGGYNDISRW